MEHIAELLSLSINLHNAGYNMIPQLGWMQAIEAFIVPKLSKYNK